MAPLIPGQWQDIDGSDAVELSRLLGGLPGLTAEAGEGDFRIELIRAMPLRCYRDSLLVEVQAHISAIDEVGVMALIYTPERLVLLDGQSVHFYDLADIPDMLRLDDEAAALEYMLLFCNSIVGDEGRFEPVLDPAQLAFAASSVPDDPLFATIAMGTEVHRGYEAGDWICEATIHYGEALFRSKISISGSLGGLEMTEDEPVLTDAKLLPDRRHQQFRLNPRGNANDH